jgi:ABC-2 type transport system ATP-binding protein
MQGIQVYNLKKSYKVEQVQAGLWGSIKSLFSRKYEKVIALDGINLSISKGEMVGLIGPNGAGKTTFVKILSGVLYPDSGSVTIDGFVPYRRDKKFLEKIALFTGQRGFLSTIIWDIEPREGYELIREIYGIDRNTFKKRIKKLTELLEAEEIINKPLRKLSLGERTKVELIGAILHYPEYIFLDEPTIGLDLLSQKNLWDFIKAYNRETGATVLITSHYIRDLEELGKRVVIINKGRIIYDGDKGKIKESKGDTKQIRVRISNPYQKIQLSGFEYEDECLVAEVPRSKIPEIIQTLNNLEGVEDVQIEDPPLESLIRKIYTEGSL